MWKVAQTNVAGVGDNRPMNDSGTDDSGRLVSELAARVGSLGVELADVAGNLEEVTNRVGNQAEQFKELQRAAETMVAGNREIDRAAKEAQEAASAAGTEIAESRTLIGGAVQHIADLPGGGAHRGAPGVLQRVAAADRWRGHVHRKNRETNTPVVFE